MRQRSQSISYCRLESGDLISRQPISGQVYLDIQAKHPIYK